MAATTLLTTNSGLATSFLISSAPVARSMARMRGLMASYRPLALMSSSMPDSRRVWLAPGEHADALRYQVPDAAARGCVVSEDLGPEAVVAQTQQPPTPVATP